MPDAPSAAQSFTHVRDGLRNMEFARTLLLEMAKATPDEKFYQPPAQGGNHAAWNLGHIAVTDDLVRAQLGGGEPVLPTEWHDMFKGGSECKPGAEGHPSREELLDGLARSRAAVVSWFSGLSESELMEPLSGGIAQLAADRIMLMGSLASHEAFHAGQISTARRVFGMPPLF
ncbi:MAG: DinB family protein [Phycisphaerales bacterium]